MKNSFEPLRRLPKVFMVFKVPKVLNDMAPLNFELLNFELFRHSLMTLRVSKLYTLNSTPLSTLHSRLSTILCTLYFVLCTLPPSFAQSETPAPDSTLFYSALPTWEYCNYSPLHTGFNASLSMFASVGLGSHSPRGVGFGKNISFAYAKPFDKRWTYVLAANANNMKWGGYQWNQMTLGGELNYAHSNNLSFSLVGYKEMVHPNTLIPYYSNFSHPFMPNMDSYVGGAINMKFSDNFFMQFSIGTGTLRER